MRSLLKKYRDLSIGTAILAAAVIVEQGGLFSGPVPVAFGLYVAAYLIIGGPVWVEAIKSAAKGNIFSEFLLMGIATIGAFILGDYLEGVSVMLFFMIGEYVQHGAVHKAQDSITALVNQTPDVAVVERGGTLQEVHPETVAAGEIILVKPGAKVPLDGEILTASAAFNTAVLTGESNPMTRLAGDEIWAGSINMNQPVRIRVTRVFKDSKLANIMHMVEEASHRKAATQRFMTKFARVYTPIVVWLAVALTFLPYLFVGGYQFQDWLYRALIFLVVACPCGLVISIPLGYFGGIGAASQNGILLKGSDFLDQLRTMDTLFVDKTGTLTEGSFEIQEISVSEGFSEHEVLKLAASLEKASTHPIAKVILSAFPPEDVYEISNQTEIPGKGLKGILNGSEVLAGNAGLLNEAGIRIPENNFSRPYTYIHVAVGGVYAGSISIADSIKPDAKEAVALLKKSGVEKIVILSGDNQKVVDFVAAELGIGTAYGGLMPEDKYRIVHEKLAPGRVIGFAGDGVNDAPVIALADVGIAMGGMGSDAAIETADVVIQTDQPARIPLSIQIARFTHRIVWQNIGFAMGVKLLVLALAAAGLANMWMAIFADVGVALIAIGNAVRVQNKFSATKIRLTAKSNGGKHNQAHHHDLQCACNTETAAT